MSFSLVMIRNDFTTNAHLTFLSSVLDFPVPGHVCSFPRHMSELHDCLRGLLDPRA